VGHRFTASVTDSFRHNLQLVFQSAGITPKYADTDMPNGPLFGHILRHIRECDFCVFDDRETEVRPNVFIELGAAIALGRPHFYFSFQKKREVVIGRKRECIVAPSDLDGMLCVRYASYEELFREFAMRLPGFLTDRGLAAPRKTPR